MRSLPQICVNILLLLLYTSLYIYIYKLLRSAYEASRISPISRHITCVLRPGTDQYIIYIYIYAHKNLWGQGVCNQTPWCEQKPQMVRSDTSCHVSRGICHASFLFHSLSQNMNVSSKESFLEGPPEPPKAITEHPHVPTLSREPPSSPLFNDLEIVLSSHLGPASHRKSCVCLCFLRRSPQRFLKAPGLHCQSFGPLFSEREWNSKSCAPMQV